MACDDEARSNPVHEQRKSQIQRRIVLLNGWKNGVFDVIDGKKVKKPLERSCFLQTMRKVPKARRESGINVLASPRNTIAVTIMAICLCKGGAGVIIGCCFLSIVIIVKVEVGKVCNISLAVISFLFIGVITRAAVTYGCGGLSRSTNLNLNKT